MNLPKNFFAIILISSLITLTACDKTEKIDISIIDISINDETTSATSESSIPETSAPETTELFYEAPENIEITYKMTEEDEELKKIIAEIYDEAKMVILLDNEPMEFSSFVSPNPDGSVTSDDIPRYYYDEDEYNKESSDCETRLPLGKLPFSNLEEMRMHLLSCFTKEFADKYINGSKKCEKISEKNGKYFLLKEIEDERYQGNKFIEIDGVLYGSVGSEICHITSDFSMVRVLEKTEDKITFAYLTRSYLDNPNKIYACKGVLVNEDGWKFGWYCESFNDEYIDFNSTWMT